MKKEFKAIKAAYSYYCPEVREVISKVAKNYPHEIFLKSIEPGLDDFHVPIVKHLVKYLKEPIPNLDDFKYFYPTGGAEEGIREVLSWLKLRGISKIYILEGEYEGYEEVAKTRGIKSIIVQEDKINKLKPGIWFISNPSGRDGNIIENDFILNLCKKGHKIFYDLSYLGLTKPHVFDLSHPNILGVFISFSKPFGLFYYRIGFTFCREPIPLLYANKWFKNIFSLIVADEVMKTIKFGEIYRKYRRIQLDILKKIEKESEIKLRPSDVVYLAFFKQKDEKNLNNAQKKFIADFQRGIGWRFCLTQYFIDREHKP